jgi:integrase
MASIANDPGGRLRIIFVNKNGDRKAIWLGKVSQHMAERIRVKVEALNAAALIGLPWDTETAAWLAKVGDALHRKLAKAGLVKPRQTAYARLGPFIDQYVEARTDAKRRTRLNLKMFGDRLIGFFGREKILADIKRSDADAWLIYLKRHYAPATVGWTLKGARQLFKAACRAEIITRNPFEDLKAGSAPDKDRQCFITREVTQRVLEACPDAEWRLIVALSRYGGLRCPSEHLALTWPDVDWERGRFRVSSTKTEHHEGKGHRWVPLFPELRPYLEEAFELAPEGSVYVIARYRDNGKNFRTRFTRIIRRAGLTPWPKVFQNLRSSRETELAQSYPLHVVCAWLGNSARIAQKHYLQLTDEDFYRAAKGGAESGAPRAQNAAQQTTARTRTAAQASPETVVHCELMPLSPSARGPVQEGEIRLEGFETHPVRINCTNDLRLPMTAGAAQSGAPVSETDRDLARIVAAWALLPESIRRAIIALAETGRQATKN